MSSYWSAYSKWSPASGYRVLEPVRVSSGMKEKKVAPMILKDGQQKSVLFHCFSSCLCCNADSIQFGPRLPRAVCRTAVLHQDTAFSHAPCCLSGTHHPWEIDILFFPPYNCSLISCLHNRLTSLTCSWSCCWYGKIKFCVQVCCLTSKWFFFFFCSNSPQDEKLILVSPLKYLADKGHFEMTSLCKKLP